MQIDYLYIPTYKDIYDFKPKHKVYLDKFSKKLCGEFRRGHFAGVLNVVNRFLEIIEPKYIFLGLKDLQQLTLINQHILKNKINTKTIQCETIRDKNGVAFSTRNFNLNNKELKIASNIYNYLFKVKKKIKINFKFFKINTIKDNLISFGANKVDYIKYINLKKILKTNKFKNKSKIFVAYYIKNIRLIDNI